MRYETKCKFCHRPISIEVDDEYANARDPYKLLPMAACNRCADLRVLRRNLESLLDLQCSQIEMSKKKKGGVPSSAMENLEKLTKSYASMIARWHNLDGMAWEPAIVDAIFEDPAKWSNVANRMWKMIRPRQETA